MLGSNTTYASFSVDDFEAAKQFYVDKLGFKLVYEDADNGVMNIESGSGSRAIVYYKPDHQPWNATVFAIKVADIDAAVEEAKTQGIDPEKVEGMTGDDGIMRDPEMGDAFWFRDPAQNWVIVGKFNDAV
jgi:catechol 2,3-dioxygenase-like lactoylglutathione lyase family enzyme